MAVSSALGGVVRRREDPRLVTGAGRYTDDIQPAGCLHAVFVRSPHAHARISAVDTSVARGMPGVVGVFAASDLTFESETARCTPREFADHFGFRLAEPGRVAGAGAGALAPPDGRLRDDEIWPWLALGLIGVLLVENFLANRTAA